MKIRTKFELNYADSECNFFLLFDDGCPSTWSCSSIDEVLEDLHGFTDYMSQEELEHCRAYMIVKLVEWPNTLFTESLLEDD